MAWSSPMPSDRKDEAAAAARGRLLARPGTASGEPQPEGLHPIGSGGRREGLLRVPPARADGQPLPLIVMLHGAGGEALGTLALIAAAAPDMLILLPESRGSTWDIIRGAFGPDVAFLDAALRGVFLRHAVDPRRIALAGFSDGASYALTLAIGNGDLFTHALAFSPGFAVPPAAVGRPAIYISHGIADAVLPINACSRRLVPRFRAAGYAVQYHEFPDGHIVPPKIAAEAVALLTAG
jgi:phospholipase/carboxylesterase